MDQDPSLRLAEVPRHYYKLAEWKRDFHAPDYIYDQPDPGTWLGVWLESHLLAAIGYTKYEDGTINIDWLLCEPTKRGYSAAYGFGMLYLREFFKGNKVRFTTSAKNRKVLRPTAALGFKPVGFIMEAQF